MGDALEDIAHVIDFELFRPVPDKVSKRKAKANGDAPHLIAF
jgi:hypothetical protein